MNCKWRNWQDGGYEDGDFEGKHSTGTTVVFELEFSSTPEYTVVVGICVAGSKRDSLSSTSSKTTVTK